MFVREVYERYRNVGSGLNEDFKGLSEGLKEGSPKVINIPKRIRYMWKERTKEAKCFWRRNEIIRCSGGIGNKETTHLLIDGKLNACIQDLKKGIRLCSEHYMKRRI